MDFYDLNQQRLSEDSARAHRRLGYWVIAVQVLGVNYAVQIYLPDYFCFFVSIAMALVFFLKARKYR
jgi:hypothetical protein